MNLRDLALVFYRNNLHGLGWKIESGRTEDAIATIDGYVKDLVKSKKDWAFANELRGYKTILLAARKQAARKAA